MPAPRRSFLKTAAAGGAGLCAAAAWPAAFAGVRTPRAFHLAVVGCGGQGRNVLGRLSRAGGKNGLPPVNVAAVCDVDADRLRNARTLAAELNAAAGAGGEAAGFANYRELLNGTADLDAVLVATPDHAHAAPAVAACDAGLAVYCEKPVANSADDCAAVLAAAARTGAVVQVGSHERSNARVRRACALVRGGAVGKLNRVVLHLPTDQGHHRAVSNTKADAPTADPPAGLDYSAWLGPALTPDAAVAPAAWPDMRAVDPGLPSWMPPAGPHFWWRFVSLFGGGEITDRGAHILDIAQLAAGRDDAADWEPTEIKATGTPAGGFYDAVMDYDFTVSFPSGPDYVGVTTGERGVTFEGEGGSVHVAVHGGRTTSDPPGIAAGLPENAPDAPAAHAEHFLRTAALGEPAYAPLSAGVRTAVLCHRINAALRVG